MPPGVTVRVRGVVLPLLAGRCVLLRLRSNVRQNSTKVTCRPGSSLQTVYSVGVCSPRVPGRFRPRGAANERFAQRRARSARAPLVRHYCQLVADSFHTDSFHTARSADLKAGKTGTDKNLSPPRQNRTHFTDFRFCIKDSTAWF